MSDGLRAGMQRGIWWVVLATAVLAACTGPEAIRADGDDTAHAPVLLLGETHDNAEGHRQRLRLLRERVEAGWRPAIAMEQFDREHQPALDRAMRECTDADCVVRMAAPGKSGWTWAYYTPVIALAMEFKLPLLAANLSRADAGKVIANGLAAGLDAQTRARFRLDQGLPPALLAAQVEAVRVAHCGKLPEAMLEPMASAQIARDVWMARTVADHAGNGVVLIAGNGHVRRDIAVPYWLHQDGHAAIRSVGFVEDADEGARYDAIHRIPPATRPDPCASLR